MRTGPHANTLVADGGKDRILDYCIRSKCNVLKVMEFERDFFRHLKGQCPGIVIIGRVYTSEQGNYGDAARKHTNTVVSMARQFPEVDYWEGFNETGYESPWTAKYAEAEVERVLRLADVGAKAIVGNFSTGQPRVVKDDGGKTLREFLPAINAAIAHGGALGLHEYDAPTLTHFLDRDRGEVDLWDPSIEGWTIFRYKKVLAGLGNPDIPVFITEGGIDGGVRPRPGPQGGGWWDFRDYPDPALGDYARQRYWLMWHYSHDLRVRGVTSFGECSADPTWHSFSMWKDLNMMEAIIQAESALPVGHFPSTSPPPPPPPEEVPAMILGIDVSHWQGPVDWAKAAAQGVRFAWIKAGEGTSGIDPRYHENARAADAAGILWGPYHYWRAGMPGQAQAAHFAGIVRAGPAPRLAPACDLEDTKSTPMVTDVRLYVDSVQAAFGVVPVIYTARWWWDGYLRGAATAASWAAGHPLWVASYTGDPTRAPTLPTPWTKWTVHQYTNALDGPRFGATSAKLDGNSFRGTEADLVAAVGAAGMPVPGPALDVAELVRQVEARHAAAGIRLNPQAALQRAIRADGLVPTLNEEDYVVGGQQVVASRGESMAGGQATVYWWAAKTGRAMKRAV